jgi:hypothetical protein
MVVNATSKFQMVTGTIYKQNNGRMNRNGSRIGTIRRDEPQVQKLPTIAIMMIVKIVKLKIKHPPLFRY